MPVAMVSLPLRWHAADLRFPLPGVELESQEKLSLLEWLANEYKRFGCQLECVVLRLAALDWRARARLSFATNSI
jgi:hypothetical protein